MAHWPLHPAPLDDEPLSSWITRLAAAYEMEPMAFCQDALDLPSQSLQELDECPPAELITTLADHTGWAISRVEAMTLRHYEGIVFETFDLAAPQAMSALLPRFHPDRRHGDDRAHDLRQWRQLPPWLLPRESTAAMPFCPLCIADGPVVYPRTAWSLALTTVCRRHEVVLRDRCPACAEPVLRFWVRLAPQRWAQCWCGAAFAQPPTRPAPAPVLWLANRAHEALTTLELVGHLLRPWPHAFLESCQRVSLKGQTLLRRVQGLPVAMLGPLVEVLGAQDPPTVTRFLIETGIQALGLWEEPRTWAHGYIRACRRVGMSAEAIRSRSRSFPPSFYGALDDSLFDERVERAVARALERARRRWWQNLP